MAFSTWQGFTSDVAQGYAQTENANLSGLKRRSVNLMSTPTQPPSETVGATGGQAKRDAWDQDLRLLGLLLHTLRSNCTACKVGSGSRSLLTSRKNRSQARSFAVRTALSCSVVIYRRSL